MNRRDAFRLTLASLFAGVFVPRATRVLLHKTSQIGKTEIGQRLAWRYFTYGPGKTGVVLDLNPPLWDMNNREHRAALERTVRACFGDDVRFEWLDRKAEEWEQ